MIEPFDEDLVSCFARSEWIGPESLQVLVSSCFEPAITLNFIVINSRVWESSNG